jgi:hypothetical protein
MCFARALRRETTTMRISSEISTHALAGGKARRRRGRVEDPRWQRDARLLRVEYEDFPDDDPSLTVFATFHSALSYDLVRLRVC